MRSPSPYPADALRARIEAQRERQAARGAPVQPTETAGDRPRHGRQPAKRSSSAKAQRSMRWLHVYLSMVAFVVILFFGLTGLLLNHPSWLGGDEIVTTTIEGSLPETVRDDAGDVEFLAVSQFVRDEHGVVGEVTNFDQVGAEGSINYTGAGYGATVRFDVETLDFDITVREEGFVNAMRDLHTGSDTGSLWQWTIDIAAVFLVVVALTGLAIQLFMRKRRVSALSWLAGGTVVTILLVWWALP